MLALLWNLSAAIRGYLRFYMPTNRALDWLRTPARPQVGVPVAARGDAGLPLRDERRCSDRSSARASGWLNVLVILFLLERA